MLLKEIVYSSVFWNLNLKGIVGENLLVGKNSVGKSKTIRAIAQVADIISQRLKLTHDLMVVLVLSDDEEEIHYAFQSESGIVVKETLESVRKGEKKMFISREKMSAVLEGDSDINAPEDKLIIHIRRDTVKYPYIEKLVNWAQSVNGFSFNEIEQNPEDNTDSWFIGDKISLLDMIHSVTDNGSNAFGIVDRMNAVGYSLRSVREYAPKKYPDIKFVVVIEDGVIAPLFSGNLSKGMYRTLFTLSLIEYLARSKKPSMILIDDFCEGLDYDRSVSVGKMVYEFCRDNGIQLVAASNDSYLMDVVSLDCWHILVREESRVSAINMISDPVLFEDFEFSGLKNIHLLSSDFIARHKDKKGMV